MKPAEERGAVAADALARQQAALAAAFERIALPDLRLLDQAQRVADQIAKAAAQCDRQWGSTLAALDQRAAHFDAIHAALSRSTLIDDLTSVSARIAEELQLPAFDQIAAFERSLQLASQQIALLQSERLADFSSLSAAISAALQPVEAGALAEALRRQYHVLATEMEGRASLESEVEGEGLIAFLWTWLLNAFTEIGETVSLETLARLVSILVPVIALAVQLQDSASMRESADRIVEAIANQSERTSPSQIGGGESEDHRVLVVTQRLNLRAEPSEVAAVLAVMSPNQTVTLLREEGEWCYVSYEDHINGLPRHGWAHRDYLNDLASSRLTP